MQIIKVKTKAEIEKCLPVLLELRPHLDVKKLGSQIKRQIKSSGYQLACIELDSKIHSVVGYRITEFLAWGRVLYIDDLITSKNSQRKGFAGAIMDWVYKEAVNNKCDQVHLDSGYQRHEAHRLYLNKKFKIGCHHFYMEIK